MNAHAAPVWPAALICNDSSWAEIFGGVQPPASSHQKTHQRTPAPVASFVGCASAIGPRLPGWRVREEGAILSAAVPIQTARLPSLSRAQPSIKAQARW